MRFSTVAIAASVASSASAVSICDKYTTALLKNNTAANQYALVTLLVKTAALGNFTGPGSANPTLPGSVMAAPGFLAPATYMGESVNLMPYFTGEFASTNRNGVPTSVNWLDGGSSTDPLSVGAAGSNQYTLISHLVQYFGVLLGCSTYGQPGFPVYAGSNSQYSVHKYMDLSEAEFSYFIAQVGASAASFGASTADITAAATALNSTFGYRCAPAAMVAPNTPKEAQVICQGSSCPIATDAVASCTGAAAVPMYTPSEPASFATPYPTGAASSMAGTASGSAMPTTSTVAPFNPNAAPRQTAAAGLLAGAAAIAAVLL